MDPTESCPALVLVSDQEDNNNGSPRLLERSLAESHLSCAPELGVVGDVGRHEKKASFATSPSEDSDKEESKTGGEASSTEETDMGQSDQIEDSGESSAAKATTKRRKGYTHFDKPELMQKGKERTKAVCAGGKSLVQSVQQLEALTKTKIFLKAEYVSPSNKVFHFCHGTDFKLREESHVQQNQQTDYNDANASFSQEDIREAVFQGVAEGLAQQNMLNANPVSADNLQQDLFNSSSVLTRRPSTFRRRTTSKNACQQCLRKVEYVAGPQGTLIPAHWFYCSTLGCKAKVHNDCVGLPFVNYEEIKDLEPWFCYVHVGVGRPPVTVDVQASSSNTLQKDVNMPSTGVGNFSGSFKLRSLVRHLVEGSRQLKKILLGGTVALEEALLFWYVKLIVEEAVMEVVEGEEVVANEEEAVTLPSSLGHHCLSNQ